MPLREGEYGCLDRFSHRTVVGSEPMPAAYPPIRSLPPSPVPTPRRNPRPAPSASGSPPPPKRRRYLYATPFPSFPPLSPPSPPSPSFLPLPVSPPSPPHASAHIPYNQSNNRPSVLRMLEGLAATGSEFDSSARFPPPRCHPSTRKSLRDRITRWVRDREPESRMLWITGSAGTGKSAIAQTVAEQFHELGFLGATCFFSRPDRRDDPNRVIPTLAYQFAKKIPFYGSDIFLRPDNGSLTPSHRPALFKEFIIRPLQLAGGPFLVILDGLDECKSEEAQCQFIELIKLQLGDVPASSLLWMICSRPEPHLEHVFREAEAEGLCWVEELRVDDPEAQSDTECYLRDEFHRISKKYPAILGEGGVWPPREVFDKIVHASSGLFVFCTTVTRFIDQPNSDPRIQLKAIVAAIEGTRVPGAPNPLMTIDNLYLEILERLHSDTRPMTLRIFGFCAVSPPLPVLHFTQLLELDLNAVRTTLHSVHSVLAVPYGPKLVEEPLRFYHASFLDFLTNPDRSGTNALRDLNYYRYLIAEACLRVLDNTPALYASGLAWDSSEFEDVNPSNLSVSHHIFTSVLAHIWDICTKIDNPESDFVRNKVVGLDYRCLRSVSDMVPVRSFVAFLRWLYPLTQRMRGFANFIRTYPKYDTDVQFLEKCPDFLKPLELDSEGEITDGCYVLIGSRVKIVLVLVVPNSVMIYSKEDIDDL